MKGLGLELVGLLVQGLVFLGGLALSIAVGMALAARLDGPGGLLVATVIAAGGLLTAAVLSQLLRDRLVERDADRS